MTNTRECYIPTHDPDHVARVRAIWQAAGERLGLLPPTEPRPEDTA
ncbi:hypothetical protein [Microbacterium sp. p3-SID131]|nr:hypothetical protein [Microbacterium sp. p3-SID131]MCT1363954.1 hypothetical protein [Microbacterium sp. p3-SID131]